MLPIEYSINYMQMSIASNKMNYEFMSLSKLYFSSNPIYHKFNIQDLMRPYNLQNIYQHDNYYKGLLLLNTPDCLALMIRDISELV